MPALRRFSTPPCTTANGLAGHKPTDEWTLVERDQRGNTASYWPALGAHSLYPTHAYPPPLAYRAQLPPCAAPPPVVAPASFKHEHKNLPAIRVAPPTPQRNGYVPRSTQPFFTPGHRVHDEKSLPALPFPLIPPRSSSRASTAPSVAPSSFLARPTSRASTVSATGSSSLVPSTPSSPSMERSPASSSEHVPSHPDLPSSPHSAANSQQAYAALMVKHTATLDGALKSAQALSEAQNEVRALRDRLAQCHNVMQMLVDWGRLLRDENELLREQAGADPGVALWEPDLSTLFPDTDDDIEELESVCELEEVF